MQRLRPDVIISAENAIGYKGDIAVTNVLADAIGSSTIGLHVRFAFCNLLPYSRARLAAALKENNSLSGFTCLGNPDGYKADAAALREAVIETNAPLVIWNNEKLPEDVVAARQKRMKESSMAPKKATHTSALPSGPSPQPTEAVAPSLREPEQYLLFFSYAQLDTLTETQLFYMQASQRFPGKRIFHDANSQFKLKDLVEKVKHSKNVIVLLSGNYARRPFTMVELHYALKSGSNVCAVKVDKAGMLPFDFEKVETDLKSGEIVHDLNEEGWALLREYDITVEDVVSNLKQVMDVKANDYRPKDDLRLQKVVFDMVFENIMQ